MGTASCTDVATIYLSRAKRFLLAAVLGALLAGVTTLASTRIASAAKSRLEVKVANSALGRVLFTTSGMALYTYAQDTKGHSNCSGSCLAVWPALTVPEGFTPTGIGVRGLGAIVRSNGERQVTWNGLPLYTFVSDANGKVTGNGVGGFVVARLRAKTAAGTTWTMTSSGGYDY